MPAAAKISAQDEATILARHDGGERDRAPGPRRRVGPSAAAAVAAVSPSRGGFADGLVRLRRGKEACWVDPLAESTRYEQLLAEGFTA